jgi:predicted outer membrane repeat protein
VGSEFLKGLAGRAGGALNTDADSASVTIESSTFSSNTAHYYGGAVNVDDERSTLSIVSSHFISNTATRFDGGAIDSSGRTNTIHISGTRFLDNYADDDGGALIMYGDWSTLALVNSDFRGNAAGEDGGALSEEGDHDRATIVGCTFNGNRAGGDGGAFLLWGDPVTMTITRSAFEDNAAAEDGGAIEIHSYPAILSIVDSAFTHNEAMTHGGAIDLLGKGVNLDMTNVTLSGNESGEHGGGIAVRGDITAATPILADVDGEDEENEDRVAATPAEGNGLQAVDVTTLTVRLNNVTIAGNSADTNGDGIGDGGGIWITPTLVGRVNVANTIIGSNADAGNEAPDCFGGVGSFVSFGYSLLGNASGCGWTSATGDQVGTGISPLDPGLEPLAGAPAYHALESDSLALDTGNPATVGGPFPACAATDQRGVTRPQRAACDVGAYEARELRVYLPIVLRRF